MSVAVVVKAFQLLERIAEEKEAVTLAELASQAALPKPTAYRILQTMLNLGYLAQDDGKRYYLTPKMASLSQDSREEALKLRILPHMRRINSQFNETVNLGVLNGTSVHYIGVIETSRSLRMMVHPNAIDEFYSTAIGKAIVAYLPVDEQEMLLRAIKLQPFTHKTIKTKAGLRSELAEIRTRGWSIDDEETTQGVVCLAIPLLHDNRPIAGVSVTIPKTRLTHELQKGILSALMGIAL